MAPNSPTYLSATPSQILTEYYAWMFDDLKRAGKLGVEDEDADFDLDEALADIEREEQMRNGLDDDWEQEIHTNFSDDTG